MSSFVPEEWPGGCGEAGEGERRRLFAAGVELEVGIVLGTFGFGGHGCDDVFVYGSGSAELALPLPFVPPTGTSLNDVHGNPSPCCPSSVRSAVETLGGSISISLILPKSIMTSPFTAHPAVPYPPALTEGLRSCAAQKRIILYRRVRCGAGGERARQKGDSQ